MDTNSVIQLISTIGFPIVMCLLFVIGFKYVFDKAFIPMINKLTDQNEAISRSLDNNTAVLRELCEKMEAQYGKNESR